MSSTATDKPQGRLVQGCRDGQSRNKQRLGIGASYIFLDPAHPSSLDDTANQTLLDTTHDSAVELQVHDPFMPQGRILSRAPRDDRPALGVRVPRSAVVPFMPPDPSHRLGNQHGTKLKGRIPWRIQGH